MINVLPVNDREKLKNLFCEVGFEFNDNSGAVIADEKGKILGKSLYYIDDNSITVIYIEPESDVFLADGILRSALHVADFRGIVDAFYGEKVSIRLLKQLDFIKSETDKSLKIEKLHQSSCNCQK